MTHDEIEVCFCAGRDAPETATCPHHPATGEAHWWTRGFAYTARLSRALYSEGEIDRLRAALLAWQNDSAAVMAWFVNLSAHPAEKEWGVVALEATRLLNIASNALLEG